MCDIEYLKYFYGVVKKPKLFIEAERVLKYVNVKEERERKSYIHTFPKSHQVCKKSQYFTVSKYKTTY